MAPARATLHMSLLFPRPSTLLHRRPTVVPSSLSSTSFTALQPTLIGRAIYTATRSLPKGQSPSARGRDLFLAKSPRRSLTRLYSTGEDDWALAQIEKIH